METIAKLPDPLPEGQERSLTARVLILIFLLAALLGGGLAGIAHALNNPDNMVPADANPGGGGFIGHCVKGELGDANPCQTDNRDVYWYVETGTYSDLILEAPDIEVVRSVIVDRYGANTVLVAHRHLSNEVVFTGSGETDIIYREGPVPSPNTGYTWCDDPVDGAFYKCDQQYIRIEGGGSYTIGLTCHETGHAVGLLHGLASSPNVPNDAPVLKCMKKPTPADENLGPNNQDNIDATY